MSNQILNYFAQINGSFIHAKGRAATLKMIELLDCKPGESILELGFGTGATLNQLSSCYTQTNFTGYDVSEVMFEAAGKRLKFCRSLHNVILKNIMPGAPFPDPDNSFDKIFVESVLAIQEGNQLKDVLVDLKRLLKRNGQLIFNETIWLDSVSSEEADNINRNCKDAFGIIQSNSRYTHLKNWIQLLNETGFEIELIFHANELKYRRFYFPVNAKVFLSELINVKGKVKSVLSRKLTKERESYTKEMNRIIPPGRKFMEGIIIKAKVVRDHVV